MYKNLLIFINKLNNIYLIPNSEEIILKISFTSIFISFSLVVMNSDNKGNKLIKCDFFFLQNKSHNILFIFILYFNFFFIPTHFINFIIFWINFQFFQFI